MRRAALAAVLVVLGVAPAAVAQEPPEPPEPPVVTPQVDVAVNGPRGQDGWFVGPVSIDWTVVPADAQTTGCDETPLLTDTAGTTRECEAQVGDVQTTTSVTVRIDATAPQAAGAAPSRAPDADGWYNRAVTFTWTGSDATSGIGACTVTTYAGPDDPARTLTGQCRDRAGNASAAHPVTLRFDATPPAVTGVAPARAPDSGAWFRAPVDLVWSGADATSGIASCTTATYAGGDPLSGTCRDRAGNTSAPQAASVPYDATAPALDDVRTAARCRGARVTWDADGATSVEVTRRPGREGAASSVVYTGDDEGFTDLGAQRGQRYRYTVVATDQAGNTRTVSSKLHQPSRLLAPARGADVDGPPRLRWCAVRGAAFYNVQLFRGERKVLSTWPTRPRLQLRPTWRFAGRTEQLTAGDYRWYVWAARGSRSAPRYGRLLGRGSFTVR